MDELRAAESIRYLANQYSAMVFVAEQLEKIGSLKGQIDSLTLRHSEAERALGEVADTLEAKRAQVEHERLEHEQASKHAIAEYAEKCHALDEAFIARQIEQELEIAGRATAAEADAQKARDAHQTHMVELNAHLSAMGTRVVEATLEAVAAEARRDRAQETVNKLQATIASIKIEGIE